VNIRPRTQKDNSRGRRRNRTEVQHSLRPSLCVKDNRAVLSSRIGTEWDKSQTEGSSWRSRMGSWMMSSFGWIVNAEHHCDHPSRELRQADVCRDVQGPSKYRLAAGRGYKHRRSADQTAWDSEA
jgi:hypothetical protein